MANVKQTSSPPVVEFRRVHAEDYEDVISIRENVYGGLDFLPSLFRIMMENHIGYAAICNGKMAAFNSITFVDGGETMVTRGLRVSKDYEGKGLVPRLKEFIKQQHKQNSILRQKAYTFDNPRLLKRMEDDRAHLVLRKVVKHFHGIATKMCSTLPTGPKVVKILQKTDLQRLLRSDEAKSALFPEGRFVVDWVPYRVLESNVDHFFNEFCHVVGSDPMGGHSDLLTIGVGYPAPLGIRYNLDVFGKMSKEALSQHVAEHIWKSATLGHDSVHVYVYHDTAKHDEHVITATMEMCDMKLLDTDVLYSAEEPM